MKNVRRFRREPTGYFFTHFLLGIPADSLYAAQLDAGSSRWESPSIMEDLKTEARNLNLWNTFLAKGHYKEGAGFTNVEHGLMAELLGRSRTASEVSLISIFETSMVG